MAPRGLPQEWDLSLRVPGSLEGPVPHLHPVPWTRAAHSEDSISPLLGLGDWWGLRWAFVPAPAPCLEGFSLFSPVSQHRVFGVPPCSQRPSRLIPFFRAS